MPLVLLATPVYDNTSGECFGMTVIEADISKQIMGIMLAHGTIDSEIYVGDGTGRLWVSSNPEDGVRMARAKETIPDLPPQVAEMLAKEGEPFELREENEYVAERFYVDPTGRGVLLFARLPNEE